MSEIINQIYKIADITVSVKASGETLLVRGAKYLSNTPPPYDITIDISPEFLQKKQKENPHLSVNDCEYIWTGSEFYRGLLDFDGFMLHASAVVVNNVAYLFSAPCGTGKSTHTALWQKHFGAEYAYILNDDKPAILYRNGVFLATGTPWSGKKDSSSNSVASLGGITFLTQSKVNHIKRIRGSEALGLFLNQTLRPSNPSRMEKLLALSDKLLLQVPVFHAGVNMSSDAVRTTFDAMSEAANAK